MPARVAGAIRFLQRIRGEIVCLEHGARRVVYELSAAFADAKFEVVPRLEEVSAIISIGGKKASSLPPTRRRDAQQIKDRRRDIDQPAGEIQAASMILRAEDP